MGHIGDGQNILWCKDLPGANKGGGKIWVCMTLPSLGSFGLSPLNIKTKLAVDV